MLTADVQGSSPRITTQTGPRLLPVLFVKVTDSASGVRENVANDLK